MHLPDHFLDPATMAATALLSGGAVAYSLFRLRNEAAARALPAAAVGAGVFAAQMLNFPIAAGTSGHLVGGAMAGMLLGPWAGLLAMSAVLAVQAIVFGDGGILALGANILNMGVIGVAVGVMVDRMLVAQRDYSTSNLVPRAAAAALAGWLSVVAAALACAIEMAAAGTASLSEAVPALLSVHTAIGLAEGALTACAYAMHPGMSLPSRDQVPQPANQSWPIPMLILATIVLVALAPLATTLPDGLESAAEELGSLGLVASVAIPSVFADYAIPGIASSSIATVLAGMLGVALVYGTIALTLNGARAGFR